MAATVQVSIYSCSATTPAGSSGETTGMCFNRLDSRSLTSGPIPIPTGGVGTNYSWPKYLALEVTATGETSIENRQVARSAAAAAGLIIYWGTSSAYVQPSSGIGTDSVAADDVDPDAATTDWTALTTSYAAFSTYSSDTAAGRNGDYVKLGLGVSSTGTYLGGPGSAIALPDILIQYDEA